MKSSFSILLRTVVAAIAVGMVMAPLADAAGGGGRGGGRGGGGGGGGAQAGQQPAGGGGARAGGGGGGDRQAAQINNSKADARTNSTRSTSVNNVNNVSTSKNVNVNVEGGWDNDRHYHPVAAAAAVTATAVVIGSIVAAPPPGCVPVNVGGTVYQQCGSTWYAPQGSQFVVVAPPK